MRNQDERILNPFLIFGAVAVVAVGLAAGFLLTRESKEPAQPETVKTATSNEAESADPQQPSQSVAKPQETALPPEEVVAGETRIRGRVMNSESGQPIEGVTVQGWMGKEKVSARTNVNGGFLLRNLRPGTWNVAAFGEDFAEVCAQSYRARIDLATGQTAEEVNLTVVPSATLEAVVQDFGGKAIPDAIVFIYGGRNRKGEDVQHLTKGIIQRLAGTLAPPHVATATSDDSGRCRFGSLEAGTYDLVVLAEGYARQTRDYVETGTNDTTFKLEKEVRVEGKVKLLRNKALLPGVTVTVQVTAPALPPFGGSLLSDASGEYAVTGLPKTSQVAIQAVSGEAESSVYDLVFLGATPIHLRDLAVIDNREIKGKVIDGYDKAPVAGAEVWVENRLGNEKMATTGADGWFTVTTGIASHMVVIKKPDYYQESEGTSVRFKGETQSILLDTIELNQGVNLSGRVVDAKSKVGIPGAYVRTTPARKAVLDERDLVETKTDNSGNFLLEGVAPGDKKLLAESPDHKPGYYGEAQSATEVKPATLSVLPGIRLENLVITLEPIPKVKISGRVLTATGGGILGAQVTLGSWRRTQYRDYPMPPVLETDPEGKFVFEDVSQGQYAINAEHEDYWPGSSGSVLAAPGKSNDAIEIRLEKKEDLAISGKVMDADGNPWPTTAGILGLLGRTENLQASNVIDQNGFRTRRNVNTSENLSELVDTGADGSYQLKGLRSGSYMIQVITKEGASDARLDVPAGATGVDFKLAWGGGIAGTVYLSDAQTPAPEFRILLKPVRVDPVMRGLFELNPAFKDDGQAFQSVDGFFDIPGLPNGVYTVHATGGKSGEATLFGVQVADGQYPEDLAIVLSGGGAIWGYAVDNEQRPVSGAKARLGEIVKTTDAEGAFAFEGLGPDRYTLVLSHPDYSPTTLYNLTLAEYGEVDLGYVTLSDGGSIDGRVRFKSGDGAGGYIVEVETPEGFPVSALEENENLLARADADGYFTIPKIAKGGYRLILRQTESSRDQLVSSYGRAVQSRLVTVNEGEATKVEFIIDEGVEFFGTVQLQGQPLSRSTLALYPKFQTETQMFLAVTDPWGNYRFDGVPAGTYEAVIAEFSAEDARPVPVSVPDQASYQHDFRF